MPILLRIGSGFAFAFRPGTGAKAFLPRMKFVLTSLLCALPLAAQSTNPPPTVTAATATNPATITPETNAAAPVDSPAPTNAAPLATNVPTAPATNAAAAAPMPDPFSDPLIVQVVARYEKAWGGDKKEVKSLTTDLERWTKDEPQNYLLLAYLGSAYALDSRDAWIGPGKLTYLRQGDAALDSAVKGDPSNPGIRLLRAMNYYELPAMFGKHKAANDDFHILIRQIEGRQPMPYTLTTDTAQAIYYYAGLSDVQFSQNAQAKDAWQRGIALAPASKLAQKMQAELKKLK
jgi:hypothetical protein